MLPIVVLLLWSLAVIVLQGSSRYIGNDCFLIRSRYLVVGGRNQKNRSIDICGVTYLILGTDSVTISSRLPGTTSREMTCDDGVIVCCWFWHILIVTESDWHPVHNTKVVGDSASSSPCGGLNLAHHYQALYYYYRLSICILSESEYRRRKMCMCGRLCL